MYYTILSVLFNPFLFYPILSYRSSVIGISYLIGLQSHTFPFILVLSYLFPSYSLLS